MTTLSKQRMDELILAERKLDALEAGGVDNWEWYGESLKGYHADNELEEMKQGLIANLEVVFGECAYEPSESGAGIAFNDTIYDSVMEVLNTSGVTFKELIDA